MPSSKVSPSDWSGTWVCCYGDSGFYKRVLHCGNAGCLLGARFEFWVVQCRISGKHIKNAFSGSLVLLKGLLCQVTQLLRIGTVCGQAIMPKI